MGFSWIGVLLASLALANLAGARMGQSDNMAKAKSFVEALNTLDGAKIEGYLRTGFSPKIGGTTPMSERAARLLAIAKQGAPFEVTDIVSQTSDEIVVRLVGKLAFELEMRLDFDPEDHLATKAYFGGPGSQSGPAPKTYTDWKDLPDLLDQIKTDNSIPALSAALIKDGVKQSAVVGERELGRPDKAAIEDRWLIGSVAKSMTSTMIARLVDKGLLRWDMTIGEALPKMSMRPEYRGVTILQLLQHRGGIPMDQTVDADFINTTIGNSSDRFEIREKYAANVLSREPVAKPGEKMLYSNAGYSLAGHIAETVAKKPFEELLKELVFDPFAMKSARTGVPGSPGNPGGAGEIMGHILSASGLKSHVLDDPRLIAMFAPAGLGVSMSIGDLLTFADFHLQGLRGHVTLMSAENFNILHRPPSTQPSEQKYACGWVTVESVTSEPYQGHNGSDGTFRAEIAIWPGKNLAIVSIMNAGGAREPGPALQVVIAEYERLGKQGLGDSPLRR